MAGMLYQKLRQKLVDWLTREPVPAEVPPYDYNRLKYEIRPGDVLLIEGLSRISQITRRVTQSPWTHAALYIGRMNDFEDEEISGIIKKHTDKKPNVRLIIEGLVNKGTVVSPLSDYKNLHIRICRPMGITPEDIDRVIAYAVKALGEPYNVRQLLDLARFLLPIAFIPRRWKSSLFSTPSGEPEGGICSSLIAEAFESVHFPVLPFVKAVPSGMEFIPRNPHLFTPKDFDFSPYFAIIKYPLINPDEPSPYYRRLPWTKSGIAYQDEGVFSKPPKKVKKADDKAEPSIKTDKNKPQE